MRHLNIHGLTLATGIATAMLCVSSAMADDTEIFISQPAASVQSNILLVIDSSGSMNELAGTTQLPYDPVQIYSNSGTSCQNDRIYYSTSGTAPSSCSGLSYIQLSGTFWGSTPREIKCAAAVTQLAWGPGATGSGYFSDRFVRWRGSGSSRTWQSSLANANGSTTSGGTTNGSSYATDVECKADESVHGPDGVSAAKWPRNGSANQGTGRWTSTASESWWGLSGNTGISRTLYSPNYINYVRNGSTAVQTRMDVVKAAAGSFLNSLPNVNLGVMRYDAFAQGGMVMSPISPLDPKRASLISEITSSDRYEPFGSTPLSETLFEAYRYFSGGSVGYGINSRLCTDNIALPGTTGSCQSGDIISFPSVSGSRIGDRYISPASESCQANYIVYLTDGLPTSDNDADDEIAGLPNFSTLGGAGCSGSGAGRCLGALSEYMYRADLRADVEGQQNVTSYYIGFGSDVAGATAVAYLQNAATRGGGTAYTATDLTGLSAVFNAIVTSIFQTSTTFTTPTVAVNAFNRTQTLEDLFVSVFQPNASLHWPGNIKKYRVEDGAIKDQDDNDAVDPNTGFFADGARSYWSSVSDGSEVQDGGAAAELPLPANRRVYTYLGANPGSPVTLTASVNHEVKTTNTSLTSTLLGLGAPGDPTRDDLINWARGQDLTNEDGDASTAVRYAMGDPIHSPPEVVIYGGTVATPNLDDAAVFVTTNDGYLHAFDVTTGVELWSFIPQEFLANLKELYFDNPVPARQYTLDGEIRVLRYDVNGDGIITSSSNDRVIIYFGMGRGGNQYYAIDVTNKSQPKYMWSIGAATLPGIGQAWSKPAVGRVHVSGATQNSQRLVLIMGGGYDPQEDGVIYLANASVGNRIYIVDALRGTLLWHAGPSGSNLNNTRMTHSIPGAISVMDTDTDGYIDRMYAGDLGAQIWRWDLTNGNAAGSLAAGGVIASLGTHDDTTPVPANARKFYSSPDVSAVQRAGTLPFMNIAIGSGYRGHPLNTVVEDRFYAVRDHNGFRKMTQTEYDNFTRITDATLQNITTDVAAVVPATSPGWKLFLNRPSWRGEKSLSPSNTFDNMIFFTTYMPPSGTSTTSCGASSTGTNRAYIVSSLNGAPIPRNRDGSLAGGDDDGDGGVPGDEDGDGVPDPLDEDDRYDDLKQGGIAPEIAFLFPEKDTVVCLSGVEVLGACKDFNSRVKTYWRESGAN
jgi:type IV pilus assembly protein PilY1